MKRIMIPIIAAAIGGCTITMLIDVSQGVARTVTAMTNGVPARIAALRAKRAAQINAGTVVTNIVTEVR